MNNQELNEFMTPYKLIETMTEGDYRALEGLSQSEMKLILKSPLHFKERESLIEKTEAMDFGTAFHMAVLEPKKFKESYLVLPTVMPNGEEINRRKKAHREFLEEFKSNHPDKACLSEEDMDDLSGMLVSLANNKEAAHLFNGGTSEMRISWDYRGHKCKGTVDKYHENLTGYGSTIVELKSARDASPSGFAREMYNRGIDFQLAFYAEILKPQRVITVVVEKTAPYAVGIYDVEHWLPVGKQKVDRAFDLYEQCIKTQDWYGYSDGLASLAVTPWIVALHSEDSF